jgi:hypothetical protein
MYYHDRNPVNIYPEFRQVLAGPIHGSAIRLMVLL